jgi:hypothetical protein
MASLESSVVAAITRLLRKKGAWYVKTTGVGLAGCPDLLVCYKGAFIALEVKREHDGRYGATPKQQYEVGRVQLAGGYAEVVSSVREVELILKAVDSCCTTE